MSIEITHENGRTRFWYQSHVASTVGGIFLTTGLLGLVGGPWWVPIVFPQAAATPYLICSALVLIGLGFFALKYWALDPATRRIAADKALWEKKMPDPNAPRAYWTELADDHAYWSSQDTAFQRAYTDFKQPEFSFQHKKTVELYDEFSKVALSLHELVSFNADWYPRDQPGVTDYRYALAPDLNPERAMSGYDETNAARYEVLRSEMHRLIDKVDSAYSALVKHLR